MSYRGSYSEFRQSYLRAFDAEEAEKYDTWITSLTTEDYTAVLTDLNQHCRIVSGMSVLDAGAGTGAFCISLSMVPGLQIKALEPCSSMLDRLRSKPALTGITTVSGFCDHVSDRQHFPAEHFDIVASRQLTNTLFDPLAAFSNWHFWLRPGGVVIVMDGLYDRDDWQGKCEFMIDCLPLSACRTTATVPYLLETAGFDIEFVGYMDRTNNRPSTRTKRYMVVARKSTRT